jgi:phage tail-like protein
MPASAAIVETSMVLGLAADHYNRYPGELVTFYLRFTSPQSTGASPQKSGATLQFALPRVLTVESTVLPAGVPISLPSVSEVDQDLVVVIPLAGYFEAARQYEIQVCVRINNFYFDHYLLAEARLLDGAGDTLAVETVQVAVLAKGRYLEYLPEMYERDDFTSRFLMLFESFWKPISQQIDQMEHYFDPDLTPSEFLPWLSSWIGLPVDNTLPVPRLRRLLNQAMHLFQCRGTLYALRTTLEIYTEGKIEILERRANNFVLGTGSSLGAAIALGRANQPDSISIKMRLHPSELERTQFSEEMYQRKMIEIIRALVPAHTVFDVKCIFDLVDPAAARATEQA